MSLRAVDPYKPGQPAAARRQLIAKHLRAWADAIASGEPLTITSGEVTTEHDPIEAVFVVALTADGEPIIGFCGLDAAKDHDAYDNAWYDAGAALAQYRWGGQEQASADYRRRESHRAARVAELQAYDLGHPFTCDCGRRFTTERGMLQHQTRSRTHRRRA